MHTENVAYWDVDTELEGYLAYNAFEAGKRPAVLVAHAWGGQTDFERGKAEALAGLGYVGFALDMFGKGVVGSGPEENTKLIEPFVADRAMLRTRILAGLNTVRDLDMVDRGRIAAIGFCFGGLCVLDLARSDAKVLGVASFHGLLMPPGLDDNPDRVAPKVLVMHGDQDPFTPPDQVRSFQEEMTALGIDWQMLVFGGEVHAFAHKDAEDPALGNRYSERADRRSWAALCAFLDELFD